TASLIIASEVAHAEAFQGPVAVGPATLDLHPEPEHDLGAKHALHINPRFLTNPAHPFAFVTDDNFLLAFTLNQYQCRNMQGFALMFEFLYLYCHRIRQLRTQLTSDLLPHRLRGHKAFTAIGDLVIRVKVHTLGKKTTNSLFQRGKVGLLEC